MLYALLQVEPEKWNLSIFEEEHHKTNNSEEEISYIFCAVIVCLDLLQWTLKIFFLSLMMQYFRSPELYSAEKIWRPELKSFKDLLCLSVPLFRNERWNLLHVIYYDFILLFLH
ncbi:hypothetical protein HS088_TW06G00619 [Tripterygium wilfordii]|uniref:Uncharacterized protein n=1 Tax=Tripterygium wilfordii TaxID=458696 RepID=A0A7J7DJG8_TRIWF|nr:hypothetical protein HS088_TW06G00619 [Tripterygium wilfordii]